MLLLLAACLGAVYHLGLHWSLYPGAVVLYLLDWNMRTVAIKRAVSELIDQRNSAHENRSRGKSAERP